MLEQGHFQQITQTVPVLSRMHFFNTPITRDFSDASHPLNIIRSIFQPGDFVAIKLDIDDGPLETAIVKEIEDDPLLMSIIAEMMFEQHYDHEGETFKLKHCETNSTSCIL